MIGIEVFTICGHTFHFSVDFQLFQKAPFVDAVIAPCQVDVWAVHVTRVGCMKCLYFLKGLEGKVRFDVVDVAIDRKRV